MPFLALYIKNNGAKVQEIHAKYVQLAHIRSEDEIRAEAHLKTRNLVLCST